MAKTHWTRGAAALLLVLTARSAPAADSGGGGLVGWVEDTRGTPVPGAMISVFGKGIRGGGIVTFSDSSGRFVLPALPAGSYTLRALGQGHLPAPARRITVLPDRESVFSVSLTPVGEGEGEQQAESGTESEAIRELRWLLRHKRRSVLEARGHATPVDRTAPQPSPPNPLDRAFPRDLSATVEVVASSAAFGVSDLSGDDVPASLGAVRLKGRFADNWRWSLGGLLTETDSSAWRMAAEFVVEPGGGHEVQAGAGYGTGLLQPLLPTRADGRVDNRSVGAIFMQDRWRLNDRLSASVGTRYSYIGFLEERNHLDPAASLEFQAASHTRLRASVSRRTLTPGGDLLTLSTLASAPAMAVALMEDRLRPERISRYQLAVDHADGPTTLAAVAFEEGIADPLVNAFEGPSSRRLRIVNGRRMSARGVGLTFARRFGGAFRGSLTYTYGRSRRAGALRGGDPEAAALAYEKADFHDFVARFETFIDWTDTRLMAFYRVNTLSPQGEGAGARSVRFDVQLSQGLPLLGSLTRADWDLLLAFRNLFYETSQGGTLDEIAVQNPPKRLLGGIAVRF